ILETPVLFSQEPLGGPLLRYVAADAYYPDAGAAGIIHGRQARLELQFGVRSLQLVVKLDRRTLRHRLAAPVDEPGPLRRRRDGSSRDAVRSQLRHPRKTAVHGAPAEALSDRVDGKHAVLPLFKEDGLQNGAVGQGLFDDRERCLRAWPIRSG